MCEDKKCEIILFQFKIVHVDMVVCWLVVGLSDE